MDGNNSAKRFASAALQDDREFISDYFLPWDQVEEFKNEVARPSDPSTVQDRNNEDDPVRSLLTRTSFSRRQS